MENYLADPELFFLYAQSCSLHFKNHIAKPSP